MGYGLVSLIGGVGTGYAQGQKQKALMDHTEAEKDLIKANAKSAQLKIDVYTRRLARAAALRQTGDPNDALQADLIESGGDPTAAYKLGMQQRMMNQIFGAGGPQSTQAPDISQPATTPGAPPSSPAPFGGGTQTFPLDPSLTQSSSPSLPGVGGQMSVPQTIAQRQIGQIPGMPGYEIGEFDPMAMTMKIKPQDINWTDQTDPTSGMKLKIPLNKRGERIQGVEPIPQGRDIQWKEQTDKFGNKTMTPYAPGGNIISDVQPISVAAGEVSQQLPDGTMIKGTRTKDGGIDPATIVVASRPQMTRAEQATAGGGKVATFYNPFQPNGPTGGQGSPSVGRGGAGGGGTGFTELPVAQRPLEAKDVENWVMPDGSKPKVGSTPAQIEAAGGVLQTKSEQENVPRYRAAKELIQPLKDLALGTDTQPGLFSAGPGLGRLAAAPGLKYGYSTQSNPNLVEYENQRMAFGPMIGKAFADKGIRLNREILGRFDELLPTTGANKLTGLPDTQAIATMKFKSLDNLLGQLESVAKNKKPGEEITMQDLSGKVKPTLRPGRTKDPLGIR